MRDHDTPEIHRRKTRRTARAGLVACAVLLASCAPPEAKNTTSSPHGGASEDLLIGYGLLADTLSDESKLGWLKWVKRLTLDAPIDSVRALLDELSAAAKADAKALAALRELPPDVTGKPANPSAIGDAITADAKERGSDELLARHEKFNLRFLLLQAQALRMIAVIATETAAIDPNEERRTWLEDVSKKYEKFREDLIAIFEAHCSPEPLAKDGGTH